MLTHSKRRSNMKKALIGITLVSVLAIGALAIAAGPGGWDNGFTAGPGYGRHMMGPMMGWTGQGYGPNQTFLDDTAGLRRELHNKRFEYFEARRNPSTTTETLAELERQMNDIQTKISEKAPRTSSGYAGGYGSCW